MKRRQNQAGAGATTTRGTSQKGQAAKGGSQLLMRGGLYEYERLPSFLE